MILIMAIALAPQSNSSLDLEQGKNSNSIISGAGNVLSGVASNATESLSSLGQAVSARGGISPLLISRLTSISFLFSGALAYNALYIQSIGSGLSIYSGLFQITVLSQSFDLFIFVLAALILIPWSNGIVKGGQALKPLLGVTGPVVSEYSLIVLFSTLGSSLLLSSGNLLSLYLAVELQSFGVYILATIYRNSESATNAGLKYFLLGGLSSCLILLGCVLIYSYTGLIYFEDIYSLVSSLTLVSDTAAQGYFDIVTVIQLGLILIFIGFLFKIAAAPFHNWAPDVYNDVPTIVTTWLSIMPKIAIVVLSFEILSTITPSQPMELVSLVAENSNGFSAVGPTFTSLGLGLKNLLLIASFLSLVIGTTVGLAQIKIKRLLAYSTISHVGFLLLALSINTEESLESLLFYLVQYSITNLNTFFILLAFGYILKKSITKAASTLEQVEGKEPNKFDISLISELKGQFWSNPLLSLSLTVSLFSMAGIPPLVGFFAKAQVLYSATQNGYYFISIVAIVVSVISAYYYLQIIKVMHFDSQAQPSGTGQGAEVEQSTMVGITQLDTVNNTHSFIISTLTLSLILFMLKPSIILNSIHLIALNIFYS
jgi:NADH-ubiquinone oxidoreductase chain 2